MKKGYKLGLLAVIVLAVSVPAGFAIAQVVDGGGSESEQPPINRLDPDPSTNPKVMLEAAERAREEGDRAAEDKAMEEIHEEWKTRLGPEELAAAEAGEAAAPGDPEIPEGTYAYLQESMPDVSISACKSRLQAHPEDRLCQLMILHEEGKIRAGAFTFEQTEAAIAAHSTESSDR